MLKKKFFLIMFALSLSFCCVGVYADDSCVWEVEIQYIEDDIPLSDHKINHVYGIDDHSVGFEIMCDVVGVSQGTSTQELLHYRDDTTTERMTALLTYMMGARIIGSELEENRFLGLRYKAQAFIYAMDYSFPIAEIITVGEPK